MSGFIEIPHGRTIERGMSIYRPGLDASIKRACGRLATLTAGQRQVQLRHPRRDGAKPVIQLLGSADIRPHAQRIGHLPLDVVVENIFGQIPSLKTELPVTFTDTDTMKEHRNGGRFVMIVPSVEDENRLRQERADIHDVINDLAKSRIDWREKPIDMTLAWVPNGLRSMVPQMLEQLEDMMPFTATLEPARY